MLNLTINQENPNQLVYPHQLYDQICSINYYGASWAKNNFRNLLGSVTWQSNSEVSKEV